MGQSRHFLVPLGGDFGVKMHFFEGGAACMPRNVSILAHMLGGARA